MSDYGYHCALPAGFRQLIIGAVEDNLGEILVDEGKILVIETPMKKEGHQLPQKLWFSFGGHDVQGKIKARSIFREKLTQQIFFLN